MSIACVPLSEKCPLAYMMRSLSKGSCC